MATSQVLSGIINPAIADVFGAQQRRAQEQRTATGFQQQQADRERAATARTTAGSILGGQFTPESQQAQLASADPALALKVFEAAGIPANAPQLRQQFAQTLQLANAQAIAGNTEGAAEAINGFKAQMQGFGVNTQGIDSMLQAAQQNPQLIPGLVKSFEDTGLITGIDPQKAATLAKTQAETAKLTAEAAAEGGTISIPQALLKDLSSSTASKAKAAFRAAGGGKDGVKAFNAQVVLSQAAAQREDIPSLLDASFPNASPVERAALDAAVAGAKTVESGLKSADKIRTEQRRLKKAAGFKQKAVSLLGKILASDQIGDVTGSVEGGIDFRFTDEESELIADIEETQNILTAENMDLMTGVLSESDIALLRNLASGALNRKRGEKRFRADTQELFDKLSAAQFPTEEAAPAGDVGEVAEGATATGPGGQRIVFNNGQWVPL